MISIHCLVYLSQLESHMASSEALANNVCTNASRIRKVMSVLRKNGMVETKEGIDGGYVFSKSPKTVTLGEIYHITAANSIASNWRSGSVDKPCMIASGMGAVMEEVYMLADENCRLFFETLSIQDIINKLMTRQQ